MRQSPSERPVQGEALRGQNLVASRHRRVVYNVPFCLPRIQHRQVPALSKSIRFRKHQKCPEQIVQIEKSVSACGSRPPPSMSNHPDFDAPNNNVLILPQLRWSPLDPASGQPWGDPAHCWQSALFAVATVSKVLTSLWPDLDRGIQAASRAEGFSIHLG